MRFEKVLPKLRAGKKIKNIRTSEVYYVDSNADTILLISELDAERLFCTSGVSLRQILTDEWEVLDNRPRKYPVRVHFAEDGKFPPRNGTFVVPHEQYFISSYRYSSLQEAREKIETKNVKVLNFVMEDPDIK